MHRKLKFDFQDIGHQIETKISRKYVDSGALQETLAIRAFP